MLMFLVLVLSALHLNEGCGELKHQKNISGFVGRSVILPCSCSKPQTPTPSPIWMFKNESHCNRTQIYPDDKTKLQRYRGRVQLLHPPDSGNFSLLIVNLTTEDGGQYRCKSGNNSRNTQLNVTALISDPDTRTSSITGAAVGGLLLLLGLGGVVYWRHRGQRSGRTPSREERSVRKRQQEAPDDVLYSTLKHSTTRTQNTRVEPEETEYATVKPY